MNLTLDALMKGDRDVADWYRAAANHWRQILASHSAEDLSVTLAHEQQTWFEPNCGGNPLGKDVMGVAAFAHLFADEADPDYESAAKLVAQAIRQSMCSIEVKQAAAQAARIYGLDEEAALLEGRSR